MVFELFQKIHRRIYDKPIYDINYSTFICPFEYEKCGKEGKKLIQALRSTINLNFHKILNSQKIQTLCYNLWRLIHHSIFKTALKHDFKANVTIMSFGFHLHSHRELLWIQYWGLLKTWNFDKIQTSFKIFENYTNIKVDLTSLWWCIKCQMY